MMKVDILILTTAYPICNDGWVKKKKLEMEDESRNTFNAFKDECLRDH